MSSKPTTIAELFDFYYDRFKPIYDHVQLLNEPPIQLSFEMHAAIDHLSRHWKFNEPENVVVERVAGHLKRATFDAFKVILREIRDQYAYLIKIDTSVIDNGEFQGKMIRLWGEIQDAAREARAEEGNSATPEKWPHAFDLWEEAYVLCVEFEQDFFRNPKVQWAKTRQKKIRWLNVLGGFVVGVAASLGATALWTWCGGGASEPAGEIRREDGRALEGKKPDVPARATSRPGSTSRPS